MSLLQGSYEVITSNWHVIFFLNSLKFVTCVGHDICCTCDCGLSLNFLCISVLRNPDKSDAVNVCKPEFITIFNRRVGHLEMSATVFILFLFFATVKYCNDCNVVSSQPDFTHIVIYASYATESNQCQDLPKQVNYSKRWLLIHGSGTFVLHDVKFV